MKSNQPSSLGSATMPAERAAPSPPPARRRAGHGPHPAPWSGTEARCTALVRNPRKGCDGSMVTGSAADRPRSIKVERIRPRAFVQLFPVRMRTFSAGQRGPQLPAQQAVLRVHVVVQHHAQPVEPGFELRPPRRAAAAVSCRNPVEDQASWPREMETESGGKDTRPAPASGIGPAGSGFSSHPAG